MSAAPVSQEAPASEQPTTTETKGEETASRPAEGTSGTRETTGEEHKSTYTDMASSAASSAATAATGVKDSVFSMFGGGAKKETKDEPEEPEDRSGSAKAQKEAEGEEEVCCSPGVLYFVEDRTDKPSSCRINHQSLKTYISSLLCISPRKSRQRRTRSLKNRSSRCVLSCSSSIVTAGNGKSVEPVT